jgi:exodeoxyribonuclease-5
MASDLSSALELQITAEQKSALLAIFKWLAANDRPVFKLGGYAGTGKSTLMAVVRLILHKKRPAWKIAFAAFTGKATQVLNTKLHEHGAYYKADKVSTLHSLLYDAILDKDGQVAGWRRKNELEFDLLIIDEASMVTAEIWRDVQQLNLPVLAVGDHGQLPPVNSTFALLEHQDFTLTHIHRQAAASPILKVAGLARTTGIIPIERFGPGVEKFDSRSSDAGLLIDDYLQQVNQETLFLTGFNSSRVKMNGSARAARWRDPERPEIGDQVVCLKNDWEEGIYNGMTGVIAGLSVAKREAGKIISYEAEIKDVTGLELYSGLVAAQQFNLPESLKFTKQQQKDVGQLFDYGYCLTVHKAQGSQAKRVVLIEERSRHMSDDDWRRWLYTGVTRAEKELYIFGT